MVIHFGFLAKIVNVETAFLYGDLKEKIYKECPQGVLNVGKDDILNKCIYGIVQESRQYYKRLLISLRNQDLLDAMSTCAFTLKRARNV